MEKKYFEVNARKYVENRDFIVYRPASLHKPKNNAVLFIMEKYMERSSVLENIENSLIFWPDTCSVSNSILWKNAVVKCSNPHNEYCRFFAENNIIYLPPKENVEYKDGYWISPEAVVGENTVIMPGCYIGSECRIGNRGYLGCGTKLVGEITIGNNVVIRENTVIGADGLTTDRDEFGRAITMPQFGSVVMEEDVQIGANVVIARGAIDETRICRGAKIDSCTYISHNVKVGEDTFVVGETIMFGSSSVGNRCLVSGNSTLMNTVHIGNQSIVGAGAVVVKSVPEKSKVKGNPAR